MPRLTFGAHSWQGFSLGVTVAYPNFPLSVNLYLGAPSSSISCNLHTSSHTSTQNLTVTALGLAGLVAARLRAHPPDMA
jgi:hypothetical protein